jgi:hypothetical protein
VVEVALCLEHCAPDQRVEATPDFGHPPLEIERVKLGIEFLNQQLAACDFSAIWIPCQL